jgi:hypothetical protein
MKRIFVFATMLTLLSVPALAAKNSRNISVSTAVKAGSTELTPGDYNVTWTGSAPNVEVTITKNRKVVVTLPAKLVEESNKNEGLNINSEGGVEILQAIRLSKVTLVLENSGSSENKAPSGR